MAGPKTEYRTEDETRRQTTFAIRAILAIGVILTGLLQFNWLP